MVAFVARDDRQTHRSMRLTKMRDSGVELASTVPVIIIESGVAITVAAAVASSLVSILGTWYFARRRFDITARSERNELTGYQKFLLMILAIFGTILLLKMVMFFVFAIRSPW